MALEEEWRWKWKAPGVDRADEYTEEWEVMGPVPVLSTGFT